MRIGIIASLKTAEQTDQSPAVASAKAAARAINSVGGVAGSEVTIVARSDHYSLDGAAAAAQTMIEEDVVAVTGSSIFDAAIQPLLSAHGIPQVGWSPNSAYAYAGSNEYLLNSGSLFELYGATCYCAANGVDSIFVSRTATPSMTKAVEVIERASAKLGYRAMGSQAIPPTAADLTPYVAEFESSGAAAVVLALNSNLAVRFVRTAVGMGLRGRRYLYTPADLGSAQIADLGAAADDFILASGLPPLAARGIPGIARFHREVQAERDAGNRDAAADVQTPVTLLAWLAVHGIARVSPKNGPITAAGLTAALNMARDVDMMGLIPPWTPGRAGSAPYNRVSNATVFVQKIDKGRIVLAGEEPIDVRVCMGL